MATQKIPDKTSPDEDEQEDDDFSFSLSAEDKPKTAQELYRALVANGFIGAWKDRADMADPAAYVQKLKDQARKRRQRRIRKQLQS